MPEERIEIPDPLLDGKAARIGTEESIGLRWKRGGFVRVVFVRFKYDTSTPAALKPPTGASDDPATGDQAERSAPDAAAVGETAAAPTSAVDPITDTASSDTAAVAEASPRGEPVCTPEELQALVAGIRARPA